MIDTLPAYVQIIFIATVLITIWFLFKATNSSLFILSTIIWMAIQFLLVETGFYTNTGTIPPRAVLLIVPPVIFILFLLLSREGKNIISKWNTEWLTWLHVVRIPVEFVLLMLSIYKFVPTLMTFEGRNFDILSGISAPFIAWFGYRKKNLNRNMLLAWNFICLALVLNVVINGLLSVPGALQMQAFEQPNVGILMLPFVYLPCLIVPAVILSHLVSIKKLLARVNP
jgi:hypothetical protein